MYDVPTYFADGFIIGKIYSAATNDPVIRDQHIIRLYFSIQIITQINFFFRRKIFCRINSITSSLSVVRYSLIVTISPFSLSTLYLPPA